MTLWIIYSKVVLVSSKNNAIQWMLDEAKRINFKATIVFAEDLSIATINSKLVIFHKGSLVSLPDIAFLRCYDISLIKQFEELNVKTFNSSKSLENCLNKWTTHQILTSKNIPTPNTLFSYHNMKYDELIKIFGNRFIVKDLKGAKGINVFLITNKDEYKEAISLSKNPIYQEYIDTSFGKDIRVHVIGGKVVACVLRESKNDFKSNFSLGGSASIYKPNEEIIKIAIESTKALGLDFAGVDILFTKNSYTVCEVNGVPGFRTIGLTSRISIPRKMFKHINKIMNGE